MCVVAELLRWELSVEKKWPDVAVRQDTASSDLCQFMLHGVSSAQSDVLRMSFVETVRTYVSLLGQDNAFQHLLLRHGAFGVLAEVLKSPNVPWPISREVLRLLDDIASSTNEAQDHLLHISTAPLEPV